MSAWDIMDRRFRPAPVQVKEPEEGDPCPDGCGGRLAYIVDQEIGCSCHISPPCFACVEAPLACDAGCGWTVERVD